MKKRLWIFLIPLGLFVVFSFFRAQISHWAVTMAVSKVTGAPARIDHFSFGFFNHQAKIKGFKLYQPKGYPKGVLVDIPSIFVDYEFSTLLKGELHLRRLTVEVKEAIVIRDAQGRLNVDQLKIAKKNQTSSGGQMKVRVDSLTLSVGRVVYKDFSRQDKPRIEPFYLNIRGNQYQNISSVEQLATLILVETIRPTAIKGALTYGTATLAGVTFLPLGAAMILGGNDSVGTYVDAGFQKTYKSAKATLGKIGQITGDNGRDVIKAVVDGNETTVIVSKARDEKVAITISVRTLFFPNTKAAAWVLYQIEEGLS
jgi:hypothetical protein